jgi:hypothetical protein
MKYNPVPLRMKLDRRKSEEKYFVTFRAESGLRALPICVRSASRSVIPAKAGIHFFSGSHPKF